MDVRIELPIMSSSNENVIIKIDDKEHKFNKGIILKAEYFKTRLSSNWNNKEIINIDTADFKTIHCMDKHRYIKLLINILRFQFEEEEKKLKITSQNFEAILEFAIYFGIDLLNKQCNNFMLTNLSKYNVLRFLKLSMAYCKDKEVYNACLQLISQHINKYQHIISQYDNTILNDIFNNEYLFFKREFDRYLFCKEIYLNLINKQPQKIKLFKNNKEESTNFLEQLFNKINYIQFTDEEFMEVMCDNILSKKYLKGLIEKRKNIKKVLGKKQFNEPWKMYCKFSIQKKDGLLLKSKPINFLNNNWYGEVRISIADQKTYLNVFAFRSKSTDDNTPNIVGVIFNLYICNIKKKFSTSGNAFIEIDHGWGWKQLIEMDNDSYLKKVVEKPEKVHKIRIIFEVLKVDYAKTVTNTANTAI